MKQANRADLVTDITNSKIPLAFQSTYHSRVYFDSDLDQDELNLAAEVMEFADSEMRGKFDWDRGLSQVNVVFRKRPRDTAYSTAGGTEYGRYFAAAKIVEVYAPYYGASVDGSATTVIHELGHAFDAKYLGNNYKAGALESTDIRLVWNGLRHKVALSWSSTYIRDGRDVSPKEDFASAFAAVIAEVPVNRSYTNLEPLSSEQTDFMNRLIGLTKNNNDAKAIQLIHQVAGEYPHLVDYSETRRGLNIAARRVSRISVEEGSVCQLTFVNDGEVNRTAKLTIRLDNNQTLVSETPNLMSQPNQVTEISISVPYGDYTVGIVSYGRFLSYASSELDCISPSGENKVLRRDHVRLGN